jgi:hypothetical protein
MYEGQRRKKFRVLNERRGLCVYVLILEYWSRMGSIIRKNESYFHYYLVHCLWIKDIQLVFLHFLHVRLGDRAETLKTDSKKGLYLDNTAV